MLKATNTANEEERLEALLNLNILDTPSEIEFDDLTKIASLICDTPIALISLVDQSRQWFKSKIGLDVNETARDISFCGHAIHKSELFVIEDAKKDPRFADNPLVLKYPNVVFYAGFPLTIDSSHNIGTLCVIDHKPRKLDPHQKEILTLLGKHISRHMQLRHQSLQFKSALEELQTTSKTYISKGKQAIADQKLKAVGELSAGVAHEINNPLTIILGKIFHIRNSIKKDDFKPESLNEELQKIQNAAERITTIVKTLREFSKSDDNELATRVSLEKIIQDTKNLIGKRLEASGVKLQIGIIPEIMLNIQPMQVVQAIVQLLNNSLEAVTMQTDKYIAIDFKRTEGNRIHVDIIDNGPGVKKGLETKIFEPFFSTKEEVVGVGLGLSTAYGISKKNGGMIKYLREDGKTIFRLELPFSVSDE